MVTADRLFTQVSSFLALAVTLQWKLSKQWLLRDMFRSMFAVSTINGGVSKIAIKAAEEDVNVDPSILSGTKFSVSIHDSNYSGFLSIIGALSYMESDTVAIIGPQTSVMAHIVSHLANELHVPLLSFTALDPTLSSLQYPYFLQTAPNDQFQMNATGDMVSYFGWKEVVALETMFRGPEFTKSGWGFNTRCINQGDLSKQ